jgi:hypothetical protein
MGVLMGIAQIRPKVGNANEATILGWKKSYPSFPIRKLGNQWVSEEDQLVEWFRLFCTDRLDEFEKNEDKKNSEAQTASK